VPSHQSLEERVECCDHVLPLRPLRELHVQADVIVVQVRERRSRPDL
jgi:hypothetical protein